MTCQNAFPSNLLPPFCVIVARWEGPVGFDLPKRAWLWYDGNATYEMTVKNVRKGGDERARGATSIVGIVVVVFIVIVVIVVVVIVVFVFVVIVVIVIVVIVVVVVIVAIVVVVGVVIVVIVVIVIVVIVVGVTQLVLLLQLLLCIVVDSSLVSLPFTDSAHYRGSGRTRCLLKVC